MKSRSFDESEGSQSVAATKIFLALAIVLVTIVYTTPIPGSWTSSLEKHYISQDRLEAEAKDGDWTRHVGLATLGLFGLAAACLPGARRVRVDPVLACLGIGYLAWCVTSCAWADDIMLSLRRVAGAMCEVVAGFAIAKRASPRQLVWIVFACALAWLGLGLLAELSLGTFLPWEEDHRFAGIFHPNSMGMVCALLAISAINLSTTVTRGQWLLWIVTAAACVFLYLTRSRTAMGTMIVVLALQWVATAPGPRVLGRLAAAVCAGVFLGAVLSLATGDVSSDAVALGRADAELASLTGRIPLWEQLIDHAGTRSWLGYGFSGFWTAGHVEEISGFEWGAISTAHSAYIDLVLSVGYIGAAICVLTVVWALVRAFVLARQFPAMGYSFIAVLLVYGLASGVCETMFGTTGIISLFMTCGICFVALPDAEIPQPEWPWHKSSTFANYPLVGYGESFT